jgi:hypothetical protein
MNTEPTETRNNCLELYRHTNNPKARARAKRPRECLLARGRKEISSLSLLCSRHSDTRALHEIDSRDAGASRLSARFDLQLRQRKRRAAEELHPFHGDACKTGVQSTRNPALHCRWTLPCYSTRHRRLTRSRERLLRSFNYETQPWF